MRAAIDMREEVDSFEQRHENALAAGARISWFLGMVAWLKNVSSSQNPLLCFPPQPSILTTSIPACAPTQSALINILAVAPRNILLLLTHPVPLGAPLRTSGRRGVAVGGFLEERRWGGEALERSGEEGMGFGGML